MSRDIEHVERTYINRGHVNSAEHKVRAITCALQRETLTNTVRKSDMQYRKINFSLQRKYL